MLTKTKIIVAASLLLGTASAALAGDQTDQRGGSVMPGSMDGVNPVYHPSWFRAAQRMAGGPAGQSFGYALPQNQQPRAARIKTQDR